MGQGGVGKISLKPLETPHEIAGRSPHCLRNRFPRSAEQAVNGAADLANRLGTTLLLVNGVDERVVLPQVYGPRFAGGAATSETEGSACVVLARTCAER